MFRYPNHPGKHLEPAVVRAARMLDYERSIGRPDPGPAPEALIILFQEPLFEQVVARLGRGSGTVLRHRRIVPLDGRGGVAAACFRTGAPAAAMDLEYAVAWGVRRFVTVGVAGALREDIPIGALVVCDRAIRDEGTSHHYAEPDRYAHPSDELTASLVASLRRTGLDHVRGTAWSTDAPYRETAAEIHAYAAEGVAVVDMEAAALFCVARRRGVEIAAAFSVSDSLATGTWQPAFHQEPLRAGAMLLASAAAQALDPERVP